jgi:hypothetical protein
METELAPEHDLRGRSRGDDHGNGENHLVAGERRWLESSVLKQDISKMEEDPMEPTWKKLVSRQHVHHPSFDVDFLMMQMDDAKKRHRTGGPCSLFEMSRLHTNRSCNADLRLSKWAREKFAQQPDVCEVAQEIPIAREHCSTLSVERFVTEYERPCLPVVIAGIPEAENWAAQHNWGLEVR